MKKEFKLPKKLVLLGDVYKVIQTSKLKTPNSCAEIRFDEKVLAFDVKQTKELGMSLEESFWHELGHYFARYYDLEYTEMMAQAFANFVCKINKQLREEKARLKKQ